MNSKSDTTPQIERMLTVKNGRLVPAVIERSNSTDLSESDSSRYNYSKEIRKVKFQIGGDDIDADMITHELTPVVQKRTMSKDSTYSNVESSNNNANHKVQLRFQNDLDDSMDRAHVMKYIQRTLALNQYGVGNVSDVHIENKKRSLSTIEEEEEGVDDTKNSDGEGDDRRKHQNQQQ